MEERGAEASADGDDEHGARFLASGAEAHLGQPRGIGVVGDEDRAARVLREVGGDRQAEEALVDVRRGAHRAADDGRRKTDSDRPAPAFLLDDGAQGFAHGLGRGGLGGEDAFALTDQRAGRGVDHSELDPRSANVDAQYLHVLLP